MKTEETTKKTALYWIWLPFRAVLRALTVIIFFMYIGAGIGATAALVQKNLYRAEPVEDVYKYINEAEDSGHFVNLIVWIDSRPLAETDKLVEMIPPKSGELGPAIFFEIFRRELKLKRPEEALFWLQLGRFRLWFDLIRCKEGQEGAKAFDKLLDVFSAQEMPALLQQHPELLKKTLQRVLDFDAKYPADDDPSQICKLSSPQPPVADDEWWAYRQSLRRKTTESIKAMDAAPTPDTAKKQNSDTTKKPDAKKPDKAKSP